MQNTQLNQSIGGRTAYLLGVLATAIRRDELDYPHRPANFSEATLNDAYNIFIAVLADLMITHQDKKKMPVKDGISITKLTGMQLRKMILKQTGVEVSRPKIKQNHA